MEKTKKVWYTIQHRTSGGNWVEEGIERDTYEEALEEMEFYKDIPNEKYRIAEHHGFTVWEKG